MIHAPRPLAELARTVAEEFGTVITYEDPSFASPRDTCPVIPGGDSVMPRPSRVCIRYPRTATVEEVLASAVKEYNAAGRGGHFVVRRIQGILALMPAHCEDRDGRLVEHRSILDGKVSFTLKEGATCHEALDALVNGLSRANPEAKVGLGNTPINFVRQTPYPHLDVKGRARDILNEILAILNAHLTEQDMRISWQMWCAPPAPHQPEPWWIINFVGARKHADHSALTRARDPASQPIMMRVVAVRPMATVLAMLQRRYGVIVTYEEPAYRCRCDVLGKVGSGRARLAGGIIRFEWSLEQDSAEQVLGILMTTRIAPRDEAGMFALKKVRPGRYHVYPAKARNDQGDIGPVKPLLSRRITLDKQKATAAEAIAAVCAAVSDDAMTVALAPSSAPIAKTLEKPLTGPLTANAEEARSVLGRILWTAAPKLSWRCLFDPASGRHRLVIYDPVGR